MRNNEREIQPVFAGVQLPGFAYGISKRLNSFIETLVYWERSGATGESRVELFRAFEDDELKIRMPVHGLQELAERLAKGKCGLPDWSFREEHEEARNVLGNFWTLKHGIDSNKLVHESKKKGTVRHVALDCDAARKGVRLMLELPQNNLPSNISSWIGSAFPKGRFSAYYALGQLEFTTDTLEEQRKGSIFVTPQFWPVMLRSDKSDSLLVSLYFGKELNEDLLKTFQLGTLIDLDLTDKKTSKKLFSLHMNLPAAGVKLDQFVESCREEWNR